MGLRKDRNGLNWFLSLMEEYRGRQASSHSKLEEEVLRIKAIDPAMVDRLQKEIPTIALLDMFQG